MHHHEPALLSVRDLAVAFEGKKIIDRVSFDLFPGEVLAVIGPNGAGKSVLLKTLVGLAAKSAGEIAWAPGVSIGYLPQRFHVDHYLPMTVEEFLSLKPHAGKGLREALAMAHVDHSLLKKNLAYLSGGQLQKVLLAWTLIDRPSLLLFDEPTENVDVAGQESIYSLLHELQDTLGIAIVIVSHDLHVVYRYADHVLCLNQHMVCFGEPHTELTEKTLTELYGDHALFHHQHHHD
jgi:zinc transport system ATP-binding protein